MKKILLFLLVSISLSGYSQQKNAKKSLEVNGVCNSCKSRIEKTALKIKGVKYAKWDIFSHNLSLILDERKTSVETVAQAVAVSGHDVKNPETGKEFIAKDEDYEKIFNCCKYRDEEVVKNHPKH